MLRHATTRRLRPFAILRAAIFLGVVLFLGTSLARSAHEAYTLDRAVREAERTRTALHKQNEELREEIRRLHDLSYVERLAREELGLVGPQEISVVLVPEPKRPR
jgi:cell division protein FtsL